MAGKLLFLAIFVPAHTALEFLVLGVMYNPPPLPDFALSVLRALGAAVMLPLLLPVVFFNPDGDGLPRWFRFASLPLNSLIWAAAILLISSAIRRVFARRAER